LPTALGAFYAYESQVPAVAREKAAGLKRFYAADNPTCEYFTLHMIADANHADVWHKLINHCVYEDAACAKEALDGVTQGAEALWHALDGIAAARQAMAGGN
jgi:pyrroloquinoline-quinone synthase